MPLEALLQGRTSDVDGLAVARLLPQARQRAVGPFVFADHFGPTVLSPGQALDIRPHPHVGLATVTYLFAGAIHHRDSLGSSQRIEPGDVNWMTAGRGIVHSERTPADLRGSAAPLHGVQTWIALPLEAEDVDPSFVHVPARELPRLERTGASIVVIAGRAFGARSPAPTWSETLYCAITLRAGAGVTVQADHEERAALVASGAVMVDGQPAPAGSLAVLAAGQEARLAASADAQVMLLGGAPLGQRFLWWNFVASSRKRIEAAKAAWRAYANGSSPQFAHVPGETEFVPLPER